MESFAVVPTFAVAAGLLLLSSSCQCFPPAVSSVNNIHTTHHVSDLQASSSWSSNYLDTLAHAEVVDTKLEPVAVGSLPKLAESSNFEHIPILSLHHADTIADNAIAVCHRNGFNPITVHVLDHAGHTLVSKRMDGCSPVGLPAFSKAKAYSCIVNGYPSRVFRDRYTADATDMGKFGQMLGMVAISQGQMAPFPGGILIKLGDKVVGAVGVSGAAGDEDEYIAIRGVVESKLGLTTVPEQHACSTVKDIW